MSYTAGVLTVSDGCTRGERADVSGPILIEALIKAGFTVAARNVVPDESEMIADMLLRWCGDRLDLVMTTGGTGFSPRDTTPEATRRVIEREAPGLAELLRWTGYQQFPRAVLSRGVAGIRDRTLIVNLPGSPSGVRDGMAVLAPLLPHAIALLREEPVDHTPQNSNLAAFAVSMENEIQQSGVREQDSTPSEIDVLQTNLDDFSPEFYEILMERLFAAGAVDVFLSPIQMKKSRPATLLTVLAPPALREAVALTIFSETTTLGIRYATQQRLTLQRRWETVDTIYGAIRIKIGRWEETEMTASPEYEDVKTAARTHNTPVKTVYAAAQHAYAQTRTR